MRGLRPLAIQEVHMERYSITKKLYMSNGTWYFLIPKGWGIQDGDLYYLKVESTDGGMQISNVTIDRPHRAGKSQVIRVPRNWPMFTDRMYTFTIWRADDDAGIEAEERAQIPAQVQGGVRRPRGPGSVLQDRRPRHGGLLQGPFHRHRGQDLRGKADGLAVAPHEAGGGRGGHLRRRTHG